MEITDEQLKKLPKFAQREITNLRRELDEKAFSLRQLEQRLEGKAESRVKLYKHSDLRALDPVPALEGTYHFYCEYEDTDNAPGGLFELQVRLREDHIDLNGNRELRILPKASNSIVITGGDYRH